MPRAADETPEEEPAAAGTAEQALHAEELRAAAAAAVVVDTGAAAVEEGAVIDSTAAAGEGRPGGAGIGVAADSALAEVEAGQSVPAQLPTPSARAGFGQQETCSAVAAVDRPGMPVSSLLQVEEAPGREGARCPVRDRSGAWTLVPEECC